MSLDDLKAKKKSILLSCVTFAILYSLKCFLISPVRLMMTNDIAYSGSALPDILGYLGSTSEVIAMSVCFATIIYGIYNFGKSGAKAGSLVFVLFSLYKYTANMLVAWITDGGVPSEWIWDVANVVFFTAIEAILLAVILLTAGSILKKQKAKDAILKKAGKPVCIYPFKKIYDRENCLMRLSLSAALVVFCTKIFGLVVNDIYTMAISGLPTKFVTVISMTATYLANLLFGVICYITVIFVLSKLLGDNKKTM